MCAEFVLPARRQVDINLNAAVAASATAPPPKSIPVNLPRTAKELLLLHVSSVFLPNLSMNTFTLYTKKLFTSFVRLHFKKSTKSSNYALKEIVLRFQLF